jgi:hypothetical protein
VVFGLVLKVPSVQKQVRVGTDLGCQLGVSQIYVFLYRVPYFLVSSINNSGREKAV